MMVHFIGAGPGAADLITVRGRDILSRCPVCLYAGSIIPEDLLKYCPADAKIVNTAPMSLAEIEGEFVSAKHDDLDVARLHSGDLSVWSAVAEQIRRLKKNEIDYSMTPGVPSFAAAAAAIRQELTLPEIAQSLVLTRVSGRASKMPPGEMLSAFGRTGTTLAIHLAVHAIGQVVEELTPLYGKKCPVVVVARASWPDEKIINATLGTVESQIAESGIERTALILAGPALEAENFIDSALYDARYQRRFRGRDS